MSLRSTMFGDFAGKTVKKNRRLTRRRARFDAGQIAAEGMRQKRRLPQHAIGAPSVQVRAWIACAEWSLAQRHSSKSVLADVIQAINAVGGLAWLAGVRRNCVLAHG
jgi:hypothetical protein